MKPKFQLRPINLIIVGFILIILLGALLLCAPFSNRTGEFGNFWEALFTSTSATCVTGLVVNDTYSQFTFIGQFIILGLIQIGGLGFMGIMVLISFALRLKISLFQRALLMESIASMRIGGIVRVIKRMLIGTFIFEIVGALLLSIRFIPTFGVGRGLWFSIFHSVSAFCNAGFDLMGIDSPYSSLTSFKDDILVIAVISSLIIIGGIGFIVWGDFIDFKWKFKKYSLHSKIVLTFTVAFIVLGAIAFYFIEANNSFKDMNTMEHILASIFASVSPRTAGFNSFDLTTMSNGGGLLTVVLMIVGAGSGSTGGGIKINTFAAIILSMIAYTRNRQSLSIYKRSIAVSVVDKAYSVATFYFIALTCSLLFLTIANPQLSLYQCLFECISAQSTVGLSLGITSELTTGSQGVLMFLMFSGRVGSISLAMALVHRKITPKLSYPEERVIVG